MYTISLDLPVRSLTSVMIRRLEDLSPTAEKVHDVLIKSHAKRYGPDPVGPMKVLGPSVIKKSRKDHVFHMDRNSITFGSRTYYAGFYSTWREKSQIDQKLIELSGDDLDRLGAIFLDWIVNGR